MALASTSPLRRALATALPDRPFTVELWDGSRIGPTVAGGPAFRARSPRAVAHVLGAPGQLGIGRAYVSGELEVDDLELVIGLLNDWKPPPIATADRLRLIAAALAANGLTPPPPAPRAELRPRGTRRTKERDARAVRHHYDLPPEFFALFLDESMTYSCAIFSRGAGTLEQAQEAKLEMVCTKLALSPGERVLDIGCGWGSFAVHAASRHGVDVVGITLSEPQARAARERAERAGVGERVEIRVMDYRDLAGERFDAIASIGMVEHVGGERIDLYAERLAALLPAGGRLLNHGIARLRHSDPEAGPFSERYVFPDGEPLQLSRVLLALERAGFVTEHVEGFASDYAETLRHWAARLDESLERAVELAGPERVRVWRLYLRAARNGFENGFTSIYQVRSRRATDG
ncbi:MAG: class I SAM-dependent methyltransferase [Acidobacteria bacterium]|nr:MAG: class I SAM-dependent methyltransferase [Acidobacteriota bacterium]MCL4286645.1 cyclopropane-fatty-acyl-phospholipid synthase family protein [Thermoleophilia bacterium]GIK77386.1 MAG: cyclopropane-fatty-acyl-phospholipid synthase [Actinomycetes bacterium]